MRNVLHRHECVAFFLQLGTTSPVHDRSQTKELSLEILFDPKDVQKFHPKGSWVVTTVTGDRNFAGTDAAVYIVVYGSVGFAFTSAHCFPPSRIERRVCDLMWQNGMGVDRHTSCA